MSEPIRGEEITFTPLEPDDERAALVRMPGVSNIVLTESDNFAMLSCSVDLSDPAWETHPFAFTFEVDGE